MKIAFDENMPAAVVRVVRDIASEKGFKRLFKGVEIVSARDYTPDPKDPDYVKKSDIPWIKRYRKDKGRIIISGDSSMFEKPAELIALIENGMVIFFFPPSWNTWSFSRKIVLIFAWIERIIALSRSAKPSSIYRIPQKWSDDSDFLIIPSPTPLKLFAKGPLATASAVKRNSNGGRKPRKPKAEPALLALMHVERKDRPPEPSIPTPGGRREVMND